MNARRPSALSALPALVDAWGTRRPALFLDYDGTLTPIVSRPEDAGMSDAMRDAVRRLAGRAVVAVISGRDRADVERHVAIPGLYYAGSHGFDISGPGGLAREHEGGVALQPELDAAERELAAAVASFEGAWVERKRFAVALHDRQVNAAALGPLHEAVRAVAARHPELRLTGGKRVHELRPHIDWDKGRAVRWLLRALKLDASRTVPMYIGDDETDEDAFAALEADGVTIHVGEDDRPTLARYRLRDTEEVRRFLESLAERITPPGA